VTITYHGTPKPYFDSLDPARPYVPRDYAKDGFIHTTEGREALALALNRYYKGDRDPYVVLVIDQDRVTAPVRYDDDARVFPHIYGPLNRDAIMRVVDIERAHDGTFLEPPEIEPADLTRSAPRT